MLQSLLISFIAYCLLAGRVQGTPLLVGCGALWLILWLLRRHGRGHRHEGWTAIDFYAQKSRLRFVSAGLKWLAILSCIVLVLAAQSPLVSVFVLLSAAAVTVAVGKTPATLFFRLFSVPATFILLSGLALLFDISHTPIGVFHLQLGSIYLCITTATQISSFTVMLGALASVSCLYVLCLSTPVYELIASLRRVHVPNVIVELMYLIYRYIFVLSRSMSQMKTAAVQRLGYDSYRAGLRSAGRIMTSLLVTSFKKASASFDAMQARCYTGRLRFLERPRPLRARHTLYAGCYVAALAVFILMERGLLF